MARILIKQAIKQNVSDKVPEGAGVHTHTHTRTQCVAVTEFSLPEAKARERGREGENRCEATSCSQEGCLSSQRRLVCFLWSPND